MQDSIIHQFICFNFYSGWREIDKIYKQDLGNDITPQVTYILQICQKEKEISVNGIADSMRLNKSAVSNLVARMEKRGLLLRTHDLEDRRVVTVKLTQSGLDLVESMRHKIKVIEDKISYGISPEEKKTLLKIVKKITQSRKDNCIL